MGKYHHNCAIFLNNNHRFKDDPQYGEILARMRMGIDTKADQKAINSCADDNHNVHLPTDPNICYACPTNKERNAVTASMFKQHILATHPTIDSDELPPDNTLIILEASVRRKKQKVSCGLHGTIVTMLGGADIRVTNYNSRGAKIDPALRLFPGSHHMCITNDDLKDGRGNGTLCKCINAKLKKRSTRQWKNWEGRKVWTNSIDDVKWVKFKHFPEHPKGKPWRSSNSSHKHFQQHSTSPTVVTVRHCISESEMYA